MWVNAIRNSYCIVRRSHPKYSDVHSTTSLVRFSRFFEITEHSYLRSFALFVLLLNYNAVYAQFEISVASLEVAIGHKFAVSWTASSDEPQDVDICLDTDTEFIPVGSIQRNNLLAGSVNITLDDSIVPT